MCKFSVERVKGDYYYSGDSARRLSFVFYSLLLIPTWLDDVAWRGSQMFAMACWPKIVLHFRRVVTFEILRQSVVNEFENLRVSVESWDELSFFYFWCFSR